MRRTSETWIREYFGLPLSADARYYSHRLWLCAHNRQEEQTTAVRHRSATELQLPSATEFGTQSSMTAANLDSGDLSLPTRAKSCAGCCSSVETVASHVFRSRAGAPLRATGSRNLRVTELWGDVFTGRRLSAKTSTWQTRQTGARPGTCVRRHSARRPGRP